MFKRIGYHHRTTNIEVRIGSIQLLMSSTHYIRITVNDKCGETSGENSNKVEEFECRPPLDGQYVSVQNMKSGQMNIGELSIFTSGKCLFQPHNCLLPKTGLS